MNHTIQPFSALDAVPNLIAFGVVIGVITFVTIYSTFANWRLTAPGRALMYWAIAFGVLVAMNTIHLWTGRYPGIEFVRIAVYSFLLLAVWRLVYTLVRILWQDDTTAKQITVQTFFERKHKEQ
jgi:hypothetical protein